MQNSASFDELLEESKLYNELAEKNETTSIRPIKPEKTAMVPWQGDNQFGGAYTKGVQSAISTGRSA